MEKNGTWPFALVAAALMVAVAAAPMIAPQEAPGYFVGSCEVNAKAGGTWSWTPEFNLEVESIEVCSSGTNVTNGEMNEQTYGASSGTEGANSVRAYVENGAVKAKIGSGLAGWIWYVLVKATDEDSGQDAYYKVKVNISRNGPSAADDVDAFALRNATQVSIPRICDGTVASLTTASGTTETQPKAGKTYWGLTFNLDGSITGVPNRSGSYVFDQTATTAGGDVYTRTVSLTVDKDLAITGDESKTVASAEGGTMSFGIEHGYPVRWTVAGVSPAITDEGVILSFSTDGRLTLPTGLTAGEYALDVKATSTENDEISSVKQVALTVTGSGAFAISGPDTVTVDSSAGGTQTYTIENGSRATWSLGQRSGTGIAAAYNYFSIGNNGLLTLGAGIPAGDYTVDIEAYPEGGGERVKKTVRVVVNGSGTVDDRDLLIVVGGSTVVNGSTGGSVRLSTNGGVAVNWDMGQMSGAGIAAAAHYISWGADNGGKDFLITIREGCPAGVYIFNVSATYNSTILNDRVEVTVSGPGADPVIVGDHYTTVSNSYRNEIPFTVSDGSRMSWSHEMTEGADEAREYIGYSLGQYEYKILIEQGCPAGEYKFTVYANNGSDFLQHRITVTVTGTGSSGPSETHVGLKVVYALKNTSVEVPRICDETVESLKIVASTNTQPKAGSTHWGMTFNLDGSITGAPDRSGEYVFNQTATTADGDVYTRTVDLIVDRYLSITGDESKTIASAEGGSMPFGIEHGHPVTWDIKRIHVNAAISDLTEVVSIGQDGVLSISAGSPAGEYTIDVQATSAKDGSISQTKQVSVTVTGAGVPSGPSVRIDTGHLDFYAAAGSAYQTPFTLRSTGPEAEWEALYWDGQSPGAVSVSRSGAVTVGAGGLSPIGDYQLVVKAVDKTDSSNFDQAPLRIHVVDMLRFTNAPVAAMRISEYNLEESS